MSIRPTHIDSSLLLAEKTALAARIVDEYGGRIRGYLRRARRDRDEIPVRFEDVVGEAFIACYDANPADDLWPMILGVLRRESARRRRIDRHEVRGISDGPSLRDVDPINCAGQRQALWAWQDSLLSLLTLHQRWAFEWHVMDGLADAEIALRLGVPTARVRVLRHRAAAKCRTLIASGRVPSWPDGPIPFTWT